MKNPRKPDHRTGIVAVLLAVLVSAAVALALRAQPVAQKASVLDCGGERVAGGELVSTVTLGENLVGPLTMTGGGFAMHPGFIAKVKRFTPGIPTATPDPTDGAGPWVYRLDGSFPNPASAKALIRFSLAETGPASLSVYDVRGRLVRRLVEGPQEAGAHEVIWDGSSDDGTPAASGVYYLRLAAAGVSERGKLVLTR